MPRAAEIGDDPGPGSMRRIWLALLILFATLSTEPVGSVQQGADGRIIHNLPSALAVARPSGDSAVAELLADLPAPDPQPVTPPPLPCPAAAASPPPPLFAVHLHPQSTSSDFPSLLERLPYDATAPPSRS